MFLLPEIAASLLLLCIIYWYVPVYFKSISSVYVQNCILLLYSILLFAWLAPYFLILLFIYILLVYFLIFGLKNYTAKHKKYISIGLIAFALLVLAIVKYYNPTREFISLLWPAMRLPPPLQFVLGFSASFLTFQMITLIVMWYRHGLLGIQLLPLMNYISFFPTLAAGPITRAELLIPQLSAVQARTMIAPKYALARILLGVWQMLVCAQWLADVWVNPIYAAPQNFHALEVLAAICAYSMQIYLDFSGLSNIVIGLGWLLGLRLPRNFRSPYLAWNIREFWKRWHISLSLWIRDYIYKPLGGNRHGFIRAQLAVLISMGLSGIWHGAAITFIIWAGMHIAAVILLNYLDHIQIKFRLPKSVGIVLTFAWVSVAWVFFRATSVPHAFDILQGLNQWGLTIQYNIIGFIGLLALFFTLLKTGPFISEKVMYCLNHLSKISFGIFIIISMYLAIEFGPSGVPNFIYAGF